MEELEKKFKQRKNSGSKVGWFFLIIAIIVLVIGISQSNTDKDSWATFDRVNSGEYYKAEIYYLVGPFAEYTEDGKVTEQLYSALTTNDVYILIKTGKNTKLPVVGEDVTAENIDSLEPITIYGHGEYLESNLARYLVEFWNEVYDEDYFTMSNYEQYFGAAYLNTKDQGEGTSVGCYIFAAVFGVMALMILLSDRKNNKNISNTLKKLEDEGKLEALKNEYSKETVQEYKKLNLELTENYLINYVPELVVVPFADIVNVYHSNMINGVYQPFMYIAVETRNNEKYYVAPKQLDGKNLQFDEALEKIRSKVKQGGN